MQVVQRYKLLKFMEQLRTGVEFWIFVTALGRPCLTSSPVVVFLNDLPFRSIGFQAKQHQPQFS